MTGAPAPGAPSAPPRRVVHVVFHLDAGGVEVGLLNVVQGLQARGYVQSVCCLERPGVLSTQVPATVPLWSCGGPRPQRYLPLVRAAAHLRRFQPDVVHARNCGAWLNAAAAWLLAGCPGRLAFTIHGMVQPRPVRWPAALRHRLLSGITSGMAAVSDHTGMAFAADTRLRARRLLVLHSGVDTQRFRPRTMAAQGLRDDAPLVLGCVARLDPAKGHATLLRAFAACRGQSGTQLELRLLGSGPQQEQLQALARELGLGSCVSFLGHCTDVAEQLRQCDLFILASEHEGRPTAIMEAMAAGLPVVASRVGAIPEMVDDGRSGLLIPPDDPVALTDAILALVRDTRARQAMGAYGRRIAVERFSLPGMVARYDAFYARLCGARNGRASS